MCPSIFSVSKVDQCERKSQLAVEHSYRLREKSPDTWVFWVHASSEARFREGYQQIAERAKIPGWDQTNVDSLKLVQSWLSNEANGRWLMIVDNADDAEVFTGMSTDGTGCQAGRSINAAPTLLNYIPQSANGSILVTSRSRAVAFRLTGNHSDIVEVPPMDQARALALLKTHLNDNSSTSELGNNEDDLEDAIALVDALDCMPLAICQAAAYISQRAPRATISSYLQGLRKSDQDEGQLLKMDLGDLRRDGTASNSIIATWQISFEHIRRERPSATQLLSLMCLFNRQGIPESLLEGRYHDSDDTDADFEDDLNMLLDFSLVATDTNGCNLQMHRLVQFSTMKWLDLQGELEGWKEKLVTLLHDAFPDAYADHYDLDVSQTCRALFPHVQSAIPCRPTSARPLLTWASLLFKGQQHALSAGFYQSAEDMGRQALKAIETTQGVEHPDTLSSVSDFARALLVNGKYEEAEHMLRRAIKQRENLLGLGNTTTLFDLASLGKVLSVRGNFQEAELTLRGVLEAEEKLLCPEHRAHATLQTISHLGVVLTQMNKYEEAELMHRRALKARESQLGSQHHETLQSMNNLGLVLRQQCKLGEAERMHRQALEDTRKRLGDRHPNTLPNIRGESSEYAVRSNQLRGSRVPASIDEHWISEPRCLGRNIPTL
jgi:tetratricopeptide (TPR) repeat protein